MDYKKAFFSALEESYLGSKIKNQKDKSGFTNLLEIKTKYFQAFKKELEKKIQQSEERDIYNKLYTFFESYLNQTGVPFFNDTPIYKNIYARIYSNSKDTNLFYKTQDLYYVKSDTFYQPLDIVDEDEKYTFCFEIDKNYAQNVDNSKNQIKFYLIKIENSKIHIQVTYDKTSVYQSIFKAGEKDFQDDFLKELKENNIKIEEEKLKKIFRDYKKQNEIDFFIHKNARVFLQEQFDLWMFNHLYKDSQIHQWELSSIQHLQKLRNIAFEIIEKIARFEDELKAIWLKPKFAKNTQYVFSLNLIYSHSKEPQNLIKTLIEDEGFQGQIQEWKDLKLIDENFSSSELLKDEIFMEEKYRYLPIDTKYLSEKSRYALLGSFDNLESLLNGELIKSDNFQALNTLIPKYQGKIDLIYIDPPFNTGSDFEYKDKFQDSTWLTLMENRLELSKNFLSDKGSFYLHLDCNANYLGRNLLDTTFGKDNFINEIVWFYSNKMANSGNSFAKNTETILLTSNIKDKYIFHRQKELREKPVLLSKREGRDGKNMRARDEEGNIIYEISNDRYVDTMWNIPIIGSTSKERIKNDENLTQKPEALLKRIIQASSNEDSLVLDYHLGSGTTIVTAQKLGRKWLGVEMGEHFYEVIIPRVKKAIGGFECGISKEVEYKGGGAFRYYELESYEEALRECEYTLDENNLIDYRKSRKLIKALNKGERICLDMQEPSRKDYDIFQTIANTMGWSIKRIFLDEKNIPTCKFSSGEIISLQEIDLAKYPKLKNLIWWR